jgi:hypothetical protein
LLTGISYTSNSYGLDPRPQSGSPALVSSVTAPNDGFLSPVSYKGAFVADNNWAVQWTAIAEYGVMSAVDGINLTACDSLSPVCPEPLLSITINGANVDISWSSTTGCSYQLQTNGTINGVWGDYGSAVAGDGTTKSASIPVNGDQLYIRADVQ